MSEENTTADAVKKEKIPSPHFALTIVTLIICLFFPLRIVFVPLAILALYFSIKTNALTKKSEDDAIEKARKYSKRALVTALLVLIFTIVIFLALVIIGAQGPVKQELDKLYRRNMMTNLYARLDAYQSKFGAYPSGGEGVRALYPLYKEGLISRGELESVLQPPGGDFDQFSADPTEKEFDAYHIGWSYNSKARPGSEDPLIGFQGIKDGKLHLMSTDRAIMPLSKREALIILANGKLIWLSSVVRTGELLLPYDGINLKLLKD
ncbi:MAG: CD225/dispanin family protein [Fibrobacter sp.]|nr:CD225/dispanin family protein [bacterium]MBR6455135.1 CD225/dispanin family protein [Fibrobacter sp.]